MVKAEDILADILAGRSVKYYEEIIEGDLDLSKLALPRDDNGRVIVKVPIEIMTNSEIRGEVKIRKAVFLKSVRFNGAVFIGDVNFHDSIFSSQANFTNAQFRCNADFSNVKFGLDAYFRKAKFIGDADFHGAQFGGDAHFGEAKFEGNARFSRAEFRGDAYFLIAQFNKTLGLNKLNFKKLYITWDSIKDRLYYYDKNHMDGPYKNHTDGPTYLALIKNFNIIEQFDDADDCYYRYRKESQDHKRLYSAENGWDWSKLSDIASWISCGYGVRPIHTVICMFCIAVIGWVFFIGSSESLFESLYFSVMTFTGGNPDNLTLGRWLRTVAMIEAILGYLFMGLFVVFLGRKFIR